MSEFSERIYIRADDQQAGVQWLRDSGIGGYVFAPANGWVQVLPNWPGMYQCDEGALEASASLLVYYSFAEDHAWEFRLYEAGARLFRYSCAWEQGNRAKVQGIALSEASERLGLAGDALEDVLVVEAANASWGELIDSAAAFCNAVGLANFSWASFESVYTFHERGEHVEALRVDASGRVSEHRPGSYEEAADTELAEDRSAQAADVATKLARAFVVELSARELLALAKNSDLTAELVVRLLSETMMSHDIRTPTQLARLWCDALIDSALVDELYATDDQVEGIVGQLVDRADPG